MKKGNHCSQRGSLFSLFFSSTSRTLFTSHLAKCIFTTLLHQVINRHLLRLRHLRETFHQIHRQTKRLIGHLGILLYYKHPITSHLHENIPSSAANHLLTKLAAPSPVLLLPFDSKASNDKYPPHAPNQISAQYYILKPYP